MRVQVLGTAAAEGWPALFCECEACALAREQGGRHVRRRTAYAVNDDILLDLGPDIYWQSVAFGIDLARIRHVLVTHSHADHWNPLELGWRRRGFSVVNRTLALHGNVQVLQRLLDQPAALPEELKLELHETAPGDTFAAGSVQVTALCANHAGSGEQALNFVLRQGDVTALIANDTGWWSEDTWDQVRAFQVDIAFLESTYGLANPKATTHHLGVEATVAMRDELARLGALAPDATVLATHFSHNGGGSYDHLCEWFEPHGIEVAYDGMVVTADAP